MDIKGCLFGHIKRIDTSTLNISILFADWITLFCIFCKNGATLQARFARARLFGSAGICKEDADATSFKFSSHRKENLKNRAEKPHGKRIVRDFFSLFFNERVEARNWEKLLVARNARTSVVVNDRDSRLTASKFESFGSLSPWNAIFLTIGSFVALSRRRDSEK